MYTRNKMDFFKQQDLELINAYQINSNLTELSLSEAMNVKKIEAFAPNISNTLKNDLTLFSEENKTCANKDELQKLWAKFPLRFDGKIPVVESILYFLNFTEALSVNNKKFSDKFLNHVFLSYPDSKNDIIEQIRSMDMNKQPHTDSFHLILMNTHSIMGKRNLDEKAPQWFKDITKDIKNHYQKINQPFKQARLNDNILKYILKIDKKDGNEILENLKEATHNNFKFVSWINLKRPEILNRTQNIIKTEESKDTLIIKKSFHYDYKNAILDIFDYHKDIPDRSRLNSSNISFIIHKHINAQMNFFNIAKNREFIKIKNNQYYSNQEDGLLIFSIQFDVDLSTTDFQNIHKIKEAINNFDTVISNKLSSCLEAFKINNIDNYLINFSKNDKMPDILAIKEAENNKKALESHLESISLNSDAKISESISFKM